MWCLLAGFQRASIIEGSLVVLLRPYQQCLRGNEEDLGHNVLVVEALIEFRHVVLRRHLPLHIF